MVDGASRLPELPYLHHPGRCPHCGAELWPEADQVVLGGSHLKSDGQGGFITVGLLVSYDCPQCGANLASGTDGWPKWHEIDPRQLCWMPAPLAPE